MAAIAGFILKTALPVAAAAYGESTYLRPALPFLYSASSVLPFLPRAYGAVILSNVIGSTFVLFALGFKVGRARSSMKEKAKKDGDENAEERYSYPKLYAEGFSHAAKVFNCVQRGHQQALETYTSFVLMSLVAGIKYPLAAALGGVIWGISRLSWADGYSTGDPNKRYQALGYGIWISLLLEFVLATASTLSIMDFI